MWRDVWRYRDPRILWKHPDWVEKRHPQRRGSDVRVTWRKACPAG
jgi:hypothetical protein